MRPPLVVPKYEYFGPKGDRITGVCYISIWMSDTSLIRILIAILKVYAFYAVVQETQGLFGCTFFNQHMDVRSLIKKQKQKKLAI